MNRDQLKSLLGEGASKEVIDAIMRANGEDVNAAKAPIESLKAQLEEANGKISSLEDEANKNLTADEQWQKQLDAANATAKQALRDLNEATAAAVFAGAGMSEDEYRPFIGSVIGGTRDETTAAAKAIADVVSAKAKAAADDAKKQALAGMPQPHGGDEGSGAITTKKQFRAMSDTEQIAWKQQNPDAWKNLS